MANPLERPGIGLDPTQIARRLQDSQEQGVIARTDMLVERAGNLHGVRSLLRDDSFVSYLAGFHDGSGNSKFLSIFNDGYLFRENSLRRKFNLHDRQPDKVMTFYFNALTGAVHLMFPYVSIHTDPPVIGQHGMIPPKHAVASVNVIGSNWHNEMGYRLFDQAEIEEAYKPKSGLVGLIHKGPRNNNLVRAAAEHMRLAYEDFLDPRPLLQKTPIGVHVDYDNFAAGPEVEKLDSFDMTEVVDEIAKRMASGK